MKKAKLSFEIMQDNNASPERRFILRVKENGVTMVAPRYATINDCFDEATYYISSVQPNSKISIIINL